MSNKIYENTGAFLAAAALIFISAVFTGTILWAIYPHIHALFPTAAANGIIAKDLKWWDSVCINWVFVILIKSSSPSSKEKSKD